MAAAASWVFGAAVQDHCADVLECPPAELAGEIAGNVAVERFVVAPVRIAYARVQNHRVDVTFVSCRENSVKEIAEPSKKTDGKDFNEPVPAIEHTKQQANDYRTNCSTCRRCHHAFSTKSSFALRLGFHCDRLLLLSRRAVFTLGETIGMFRATVTDH